MVSFFGVPYFIGKDELSEKLHNFRVIQKGPWTHKTYKECPSTESGIVFTRIEMPLTIKSLPYATKIGNINVSIKHNGQLKVCNGCLSPDHLLRSCPDNHRNKQRLKVCRICGLYGHMEVNCPDRDFLISSASEPETKNGHDDADKDTDDESRDPPMETESNQVQSVRTEHLVQ